MLKTFKFQQIIFRVLTREKKGLKASAGAGSQHQLLENRHYCFTNDHWKKKIMQVMGSVQLPSPYSILQGNCKQRGQEFSKLVEAGIKFNM